MLLKDAFKAIGRDPTIPNAVRINDHPRTFSANTETAGFGPHLIKTEFANAFLHDLPQLLALGAPTALRPDTEEKMSRRFSHSGCRQTFFQFAHLRIV